ncbi:copper resistance protein CopC, partial [Nocardioides sp.]|uniref:copper resistance protein CopC n=1 Tax=Nocardioides sp. TaxID=35761 RepID=UPI002B27AE71
MSVLLPAIALVTPASAADEDPISAYAPARESHVRAFPSQVRIVFRQSITVASSIALSGPNGAIPCVQTSPTPAFPESNVVACRPTSASAGGALDGVYTVGLEGVYANGDPTYEETYTFVVDTVTPPAPTGLVASVDPYLSDSGDLVISGTTETKTDTVFVTVGDGERTVTASNGLTKATDDSRDFNIVVEAADVATLADGELTVTARSRDRAVNDGPTAEITMIKDTATPSVVATDPADDAEVPGSELDYVVTASEALDDTSSVRLFDSADAQVEADVVVAGETVTASPSATLPDGAYRAEIDLVDTAGNAAETETRTFRVDNSGLPSTTARL